MKRHKLQGITLIEVLVGITIVAILTSVATPSFTALLSVNRLATQANEILGALTISRSEAIRLNKRVVFCRSDDGTSCAAGGGNWQGWLVFADNNANDLPDAGEILRTGTIASGSLVVQSSPAISVQNNRVQTGADGFARSAPGSSNALLQARLSVCIATSSPEQNTREIRITAGGHAVIVPVNNGGECPSPSNS